MLTSLSQSRKIRSFILILLAVIGGSLIIVVPLLLNTINEKSELSNHLEDIKKTTNEIIYYDEVLTSSARIYIIDPKVTWKDKYDQAAKSLDETLARAQALDPLINDAMYKVSGVNDELIAIETEAFILVEQGELTQAIAKMFGARYDELKGEYNSYVQHALNKTKKLTEQQWYNQKESQTQILIFLFILLSLGFVLLLFYLFKHFRHTDELANHLMTSLESKLAESKETTKKLDKANKAKNLFLANMSHEIRTPMNGVHGNLQLLLNKLDDENAIELANGALRSSKMLTLIVNDILDFSKIEANKLELENKEFDFQEIILDIKQVFERECQDKSLIFIINNCLKHNYWLGDTLRLRQIIWNILNNAVKFTEKGQVTLSLKEHSNQLILEFEDSGIGMSETESKAMFKSFEQADISTTRKYGGSGLGMSIVKALIDKMNGKITVNSEKGSGTHITLKLPLKSVEKPKTKVNVDENSHYDLSGIKILVAEDNRVNQTVIKAMLKYVGCHVTIANNGQEAIDKFNEDVDIVLMDIHMPIMDGIQACETIKQQRIKQPVIALTASVLKGDIENYEKVGFDGVVPKPIDKDLLYKTLGNVILS